MINFDNGKKIARGKKIT